MGWVGEIHCHLELVTRKNVQGKLSICRQGSNRSFQRFICRTLCNRFQAPPECNSRGFQGLGLSARREPESVSVALSSADSPLPGHMGLSPKLYAPLVFTTPAHTRANCIPFLSISLKAAHTNSPMHVHLASCKACWDLIISRNTPQSILTLEPAGADLICGTNAPLASFLWPTFAGSFSR